MAAGIFDSISTTKTHNCILEVNLYNRVAYQEHFVIPLHTFYKPMIEVQIHLYKTDGVIPSCLCYFLVSILKWHIVLIPWPLGICLIYIYAHALRLEHIRISGKTLMAMV